MIVELITETWSTPPEQRRVRLVTSVAQPIELELPDGPVALDGYQAQVLGRLLMAMEEGDT